MSALQWQELTVTSDDDPELTLNVKNHAVAHHNGVLYLLGGSYNDRMDLILYDISEEKWTRVQHQNEIAPSGSSRRLRLRPRGRNSNQGSMVVASEVVMTGPKPLFRNGHTASLIKKVNRDGMEQSFIYIIGGWLGDCAASDVLVLDITNPKSLIWVRTTDQGRGESPGPCNMHSAEFIPDKREIYVFRGGDGSDYLNDLHALNVDTMSWRKVVANGVGPERRADHSSAYMHETKEMFVFGGWNGTMRLNDFYILNTETSTWSRPVVGGNIPHARAGMTLSAVRDRLFLFGGNGVHSLVCNDLHVFDRGQMAFLEVQDTATPRSNSSHSFGSSKDYNNEAGARGFALQQSNPNCIDSIPKLTMDGHGPSRRAGHTATVAGRFIYIIGGSSGSEYRKDCFVLDTDNLVLPPVAEPTSFPMMMASQLKDLCNSPEFADIVFIVEGRRIYAHKIVLSIASVVYRAMFRTEFREKVTARPEIEIPNCTYDVFLSILEYIYTGHVDLTLDDASPGNACESLEKILGILEMSDQLLLDHLKQQCEHVLFQAVDATTIEFLMQFAQQSNAKHLEAICSHYVRNSSTYHQASNHSSILD